MQLTDTCASQQSHLRERVQIESSELREPPLNGANAL